ncbi:acetoin utilization AcuB family protein [Lysinibacillus sp. OL1_EC]|uniref:acetoin utilization AcuB family protein n=1 Tax=unclassified Lysinibacillus TaxID=2636778 RepID=UPI00103BDAC3|nr:MULTISPECIES: acetoin utilization AcuB family protein [unclassified Lysinibacillus]MCM0625473.1 acetoin utilization AcuB family protein [Lysinibacillus sp. OL1_EC]MCS5501054.1 acetoin utilization AcuB family protein [Lysinibacillus sp. A4]TBV86999.1 CBS domain-containing protein [Lysinibacillus sp. OL1]UKJ44456.1 acetoin utilization AcuB family protein [Lysinibacillus sp. ACHW1.5]WGT40081.1 acetoin utilization AcuB family protein [Lysinibacillus sp. 1 U-2021]
MIVEEIMNDKPYTLAPTNTVQEALKLMREKKVRHLPVVDEEHHVLGVITERDIKEVLPSSLQDEPNSPIFNAKVEDIMVKDPLIGHPLDFVEEVALTFYESKIGCLPIVSGGKLVGIVTTTDLLYTYIELTGATEPGSKIEIRVSDTPGVLFEITKIFHQHHANVQSVLVYPDSENTQNKILSVRVKTLNPLAMIEDLRKEGFDVLWPNLPGVSL